MLKTKSSHIDANGVETCNTCCRPAVQPYRYTTGNGDTRGCVATCHDEHIRRNTKPSWMNPRYVLPKWVTDTRRAIKATAMANGLSATEF